MTEAGIDAVAFELFKAARHPVVPNVKEVWTWLPLAARRQYVEEAKRLIAVYEVAEKA